MSDIYFLKGNEDKLTDIIDEDKALLSIKSDIAKVFDTKGFSFLLGAGCSSFYLKSEVEILVKNQANVTGSQNVAGDQPANTIIEKWEEIGIPTMKLLADEFYNSDNKDNSLVLNVAERKALLDNFAIDVDQPPFKGNLEKFLEVLFSLRHYHISIRYKEKDEDGAKIPLTVLHDEVEKIIRKTKLFILNKVLKDPKNKKDQPLLDVYEAFYRKLLYRNSSLPKPNIFTTNYDLYSERALDNLGIHYVNGFSGGINKYFNPTIFNYALAEKMDLSQNKWSVIDNFVYLYKIHGSINWLEDYSGINKLFSIKEIQEPTIERLEKEEAYMIYPSPIKQNASLGSPYSDLFREFQKKLMQNNAVLITSGYSFSDEHINNLIFQAFTIPSFRLIIFGDKSLPGIEKLLNLNDPRIWIIGGKTSDKTSLHYFNNMVFKLLPDLNNDEIDLTVANAIKVLLSKNPTNE